MSNTGLSEGNSWNPRKTTDDTFSTFKTCTKVHINPLIHALCTADINNRGNPLGAIKALKWIRQMYQISVHCNHFELSVDIAPEVIEIG